MIFKKRHRQTNEWKRRIGPKNVNRLFRIYKKVFRNNPRQISTLHSLRAPLHQHLTEYVPDIRFYLPESNFYS